jgi:adenylate kinase
MLREEVRLGTKLGMVAQEVMERGELVPDDLVGAMIERGLGGPECMRGFILDGYPRNLAQAERLKRFLSGRGSRLDRVVAVRVPKEELLQRITGRRECGECQEAYHLLSRPPQRPGICDACGGTLFQRPDDREAVVRGRLRIYEKQTRPLLEYYRRDGILLEVDGTGTRDEVTERITTVLQEAGR